MIALAQSNRFHLKPLRQSAFVIFFVVPLGTSFSDEARSPLRSIDNAGGSVAFSPDGKQLIGAVPGKTWRPTDIKVWHSATGKLLSTITVHTDAVVTVTFSPDGERIATASSDKSIKLWKVRSLVAAEP